MNTIKTPRVIERGILTSVYKNEIKENVREMKIKSISKIKSSFLNCHNRFESETGLILKVSFFAIAIICMTF
jgi:hypothetical protein